MPNAHSSDFSTSTSFPTGPVRPTSIQCGLWLLETGGPMAALVPLLSPCSPGQAIQPLGDATMRTVIYAGARVLCQAWSLPAALLAHLILISSSAEWGRGSVSLRERVVIPSHGFREIVSLIVKRLAYAVILL